MSTRARSAATFNHLVVTWSVIASCHGRYSSGVIPAGCRRYRHLPSTCDRCRCRSLHQPAALISSLPLNTQLRMRSFQRGSISTRTAGLGEGNHPSQFRGLRCPHCCQWRCRCCCYRHCCHSQGLRQKTMSAVESVLTCESHDPTRDLPQRLMEEKPHHDWSCHFHPQRQGHCWHFLQSTGSVKKILVSGQRLLWRCNAA